MAALKDNCLSGHLFVLNVIDFNQAFSIFGRTSEIRSLWSNKAYFKASKVYDPIFTYVLFSFPFCWWAFPTSSMHLQSQPSTNAGSLFPNHVFNACNCE